MKRSKHKGPSEEVKAKGALALAAWREKQKLIKLLPEKERAILLEQQRIEKEQKRISPLQAIKNFCNACVATRSDITNCTAKQCAIYIYRPYQKGEEE